MTEEGPTGLRAFRVMGVQDRKLMDFGVTQIVLTETLG